jgi:hypothetical protein
LFAAGQVLRNFADKEENLHDYVKNIGLSL